MVSDRRRWPGEADVLRFNRGGKNMYPNAGRTQLGKTSARENRSCCRGTLRSIRIIITFLFISQEEIKSYMFPDPRSPLPLIYLGGKSTILELSKKWISLRAIIYTRPLTIILKGFYLGTLLSATEKKRAVSLLLHTHQWLHRNPKWHWPNYVILKVSARRLSFKCAYWPEVSAKVC
jgi:hypothetical protein